MFYGIYERQPGIFGNKKGLPLLFYYSRKLVSLGIIWRKDSPLLCLVLVILPGVADVTA